MKNLLRTLLLAHIMMMCGGVTFAQELTDTSHTAKMLQSRAFGIIVYPEYPKYIEWMEDGEHYMQTEWNNGKPEVVAYSAKDESRTV